ncbi:MAG TPA: cupin domain-containing protein [Phycisphaerae bacterium]|nr:cupin domain-containing protein [Phycisphaerae bacterium]
MSETSFVRTRDRMETASVSKARGGDGTFTCTHVMDAPAGGGGHVRLIHEVVMPPGTSIGVHRHEGDEEYYYFVSGRGTMTLDGRRQAVQAGDIAAVLPGGEHGLANDSDDDLRFVAIKAE